MLRNKRKLILIFFLIAIDAYAKGSGVLKLETKSNLPHLFNKKRVVISNISSTFKYPLKKTLVLTGNFSLTKTHKPYKEVLLRDAVLGGKYLAWKYQDTLKLSYGGNLLIPLSKASSEDNSLRTSLSFAPTLIFNISKYIYSPFNMILSYSPRITKNFHRYTTSYQGDVNKEYGIDNNLMLSASRNKIQFSLGVGYNSSFNYRGTYDANFYITENIAYVLEKSLVISMGHGNGGSTLKPNGYESNISFFNENQSWFHLGITYLI